MSHVVAIIPARKGSKGVPGKNKRLLCGKPLVSWTIEQALAANCVGEVFVSSDDGDILRIADQLGAVAMPRPEELSGDDVSTEAVMEYHLRRAGGRFDTVVLLQPTSPLRDPYDIDRALVHLEETGADSLLSVVDTHAPFYWTREEVGDRELRWVRPYQIRGRPRRQELRECWQENGSIYVCRVEGFLEHQDRLFGKIVVSGQAEDTKYEIDSEEDWVVVESLMERRLARVSAGSR